MPHGERKEAIWAERFGLMSSTHILLVFCILETPAQYVAESLLYGSGAELVAWMVIV